MVVVILHSHPPQNKVWSENTEFFFRAAGQPKFCFPNPNHLHSNCQLLKSLWQEEKDLEKQILPYLYVRRVFFSCWQGFGKYIFQIKIKNYFWPPLIIIYRARPVVQDLYRFAGTYAADFSSCPVLLHKLSDTGVPASPGPLCREYRIPAPPACIVIVMLLLWGGA